MKRSGLSHYTVNKAVDHVFRGRTFSPPGELWWGLLTALPATDWGNDPTELTAGDYARKELSPSDSHFLATQGGNLGASSGASGRTQNVFTVLFGQAASDWGTLVGIGIWDAETDGNLIGWAELNDYVTVATDDQVAIPQRDVFIVLNDGCLTDYVENKLIDLLFRNRAWTVPASHYWALFEVDPADAGGGTELAGGGYARVAVTADWVNYRTTQGTVANEASSGKSGRIVLATNVQFPTITNGKTIGAVGLFDASTSGNLLAYGRITLPAHLGGATVGPVFRQGKVAFELRRAA